MNSWDYILIDLSSLALAALTTVEFETPFRKVVSVFLSTPGRAQSGWTQQIALVSVEVSNWTVFYFQDQILKELLDSILDTEVIAVTMALPIPDQVTRVCQG